MRDLQRAVEMDVAGRLFRRGKRMEAAPRPLRRDAGAEEQRVCAAGTAADVDMRTVAAGVLVRRGIDERTDGVDGERQQQDRDQSLPAVDLWRAAHRSPS